MSATMVNRRVGAFVLFADDNGVRYAVRLGSILALSDGDETRETTVLQMPGGRAVLVPASLEEVLEWFTSRHSDPDYTR